MPELQNDKLISRQKCIASDSHQCQHEATAQTVALSVSAINSIESIYKALNDRDEIKAKALLMLMLRDWLTNVASFDPVSGYALHTGIVDFMDVVAKSMQDQSLENEIKDRIYRIVSHTKEAALAIIKRTRDKILREHVMLPIYAAREVDSNSVQWLSRQPGRTLREKLSGKPYINAVRRRASVNTAENRLLKAFFQRFTEILIERQNALNFNHEEICEELLVSLERWLRSEDAFEIGAWGNLPPNNTLLQDKRYRKVWDGWLWLQGIDEHIIEDSKRIHRDMLNVIYWNTLSLLNQTDRFRTVQQPVGLDYDSFMISPELPVKGYLFPNTKISGVIDRLVSDRGFGFIDGCFFHASDLMAGLRFDELQLGDQLLFDVEETMKGKSAKQLEKGIIIPPKQIVFELLNEQINIIVEKETISLLFENDQIVLVEKNKGIENKTKIELAVLAEIPKTILSLVMDSPFEYSEPTNNQSGPIRVNSSVVDLCSIRPAFTNNSGSQEHLPFRLLQQTWKLNDGTAYRVDCGNTKAIALHPDIETVSMRSLFSYSWTLSDATKSNASMFFTKKLSDYIQADKLTYLVPDWGNDFDLEGIRKSINFYFEQSAPLPKSIAVIFAWQSSNRFVQDKVRENDFVLVVDSFDGGISITPIQAIYQQGLIAILPKTYGISWERHPAFIRKNAKLYTGMVRNLDKDECIASKELIHLFGFDGLASDSGEVSFVKDDHWYHLPCSIREALTQDLDLNILLNYAISECLNSTNRDFRGVNVFILPLEDTIKKPKQLNTNYNWIYKTFNTVLGGQTLNRWQEEADDIALWRDHLPELSIKVPSDKGYNVNFYLVKDATVTPQRGKTVKIPVEESFTLPAGQTHYSFPLQQQGKGNTELQFVAYLKSPAFPLKEDVTCKLEMTYTYGADDPYKLKFIPLEPAQAGFKSIQVEWRPVSEDEAIDLENLPVPDFPARKSWSDFQKFPKEDGKDFSDLLDWLEQEMERIFDIESFFAGEDSDRIYDDDVIDHWNWKEDRKGKQFCYLEYDFGDVFFHESNFEKFDPDAEDISFDVEEQRDRDGYVARHVTLGKSIPKKTIDHFKKSLRFPALTIWNHGHSLSESDVPDHFRNTLFKGIQEILSIIKSENIPATLKEELFLFLCCLHKDAPEEIVGTKLLSYVKDKRLLQKYDRNIAFAIGNAELLWQQELLQEVIQLINKKGQTRSISMEILSIAFWRSKELILTLTEKKLETINRELYDCLKSDLQKVEKDGKGYQIAVLCKHLELLLALLRSRGHQGEGFKTILAPNKDLTKKYVNLVDDISKSVINNNIELKSRISLQIQKPEPFCNTPDLLYALRMYLTGDSGANIFITGVSDED